MRTLECLLFLLAKPQKAKRLKSKKHLLRALRSPPSEESRVVGLVAASLVWSPRRLAREADVEIE